MVSYLTAKEISEKRKEEIAYFSQFIGQKVTLITENQAMFGKIRNELKGRIMNNTEGRPIFLPKGHTKNVKELTQGVFDGWYATLTVKEVKVGW